MLTFPVFADGTCIQNDFSDYMQNLRNKIQRNWTPPEFVEGSDVTVKFKIDRRGEILSADIIESSGNEIFDASTMEALRKSEPFDKFPANSTKSVLTINYSFHSSYVRTNCMKQYMDNADRYFNVNNATALDNINLAIKEVEGDCASYFLYAKRSKIKRALGDTNGAEEDMEECKRLKAKFDKKRINSCKLMTEMEHTPFSYFSLAHAYDIAGDYEHALEAIDKAISLTELNNQYKRYRAEIEQRSQK